MTTTRHHPDEAPGGDAISSRTDREHGIVDGDRQRLARELSDHLASEGFPCTQDELLASMIRRRVPCRLLAVLAGLPPTRRHTSRAVLLADLDLVPEPDEDLDPRRIDRPVGP
jgi:hypothetical protein